MKRRVIVVDGPLAFRMKRVEAARASLLGLEVLSLPLLAARLAGGFRRFADRDLLAPAIAEALGEGNFKDIDSVKDLPGMVRKVLPAGALLPRDGRDAALARIQFASESAKERALLRGPCIYWPC
jgi:hypothetical protein